MSQIQRLESDKTIGGIWFSGAFASVLKDARLLNSKITTKRGPGVAELKEAQKAAWWALMRARDDPSQAELALATMADAVNEGLIKVGAIAPNIEA